MNRRRRGAVLRSTYILSAITVALAYGLGWALSGLLPTLHVETNALAFVLGFVYLAVIYPKLERLLDDEDDR